MTELYLKICKIMCLVNFYVYKEVFKQMEFIVPFFHFIKKQMPYDCSVLSQTFLVMALSKV